MASVHWIPGSVAVIPCTLEIPCVVRVWMGLAWRRIVPSVWRVGTAPCVAGTPPSVACTSVVPTAIVGPMKRIVCASRLGMPRPTVARRGVIRSNRCRWPMAQRVCVDPRLAVSPIIVAWRARTQPVYWSIRRRVSVNAVPVEPSPCAGTCWSVSRSCP